MKKSLILFLSLMMFLSTGVVTTSCCTSDDDYYSSGEKVSLPEARITETLSKQLSDTKKATVYKFEYPSVDPYGNPTTLSGIIVVGDEIKENGMKAEGTVLYNHFTIFQKDECPSREDNVPLLVTGSKMICVAADYYGFGVTESKDQAYCIPHANAQASVDCLLAAQKLLKDMGYTWGDLLFNIGYSQGGQTTMGVVRLLAEKYPDIKLTHTIAGGGPYDIGETYHQLISKGESTMPSTAVCSALAYNEFYNVGLSYSTMFKDNIVKIIPTHILSKEYKRPDIETALGSTKMADILQPAMFDFNSDNSKKLSAAFEKDNLCAGWTPRGTERISIVHNEEDGCVPYANATKMADYLEGKGFTVSRDGSGDRYVDGSVYLYHLAFGDGTFLGLGAHEAGAVFFAFEFLDIACHYLGLKSHWITITELQKLLQ